MKRYPLSVMRFALLFLCFSGEQHCQGSLPDNVCFNVHERDSRTLQRVLFVILNWQEMVPRKSIPSLDPCTAAGQVLMPLDHFYKWPLLLIRTLIATGTEM